MIEVLWLMNIQERDSHTNIPGPAHNPLPQPWLDAWSTHSGVTLLFSMRACSHIPTPSPSPINKHFGLHSNIWRCSYFAKFKSNFWMNGFHTHSAEFQDVTIGTILNFNGPKNSVQISVLVRVNKAWELYHSVDNVSLLQMGCKKSVPVCQGVPDARGWRTYPLPLSDAHPPPTFPSSAA